MSPPFLDRVTNRIERVSPKFAGTLDYLRHRKNPAFASEWGGPMNGQAIRTAIVRDVIAKAGVQQIVETGSYRGATTVWFSEFNLPVFTVESHERTAEFARRRLKQFQNVLLKTGNSVEFLRDLANDDAFRSRTTFFYLDAHWHEYLPLADEMRVLKSFPNSIVLIDDFEVPGDAGYSFDDYGPGRALTLDYLQNNGITASHAFFPKSPSSVETGAKRGYVFITNNQNIADNVSVIVQRSLTRPEDSSA